jgi:hypothetical protein
MGLDHTSVKSRQLAGMSDPEGEQPTPQHEAPHPETASDSGPSRGMLEFDRPGPDCTKEGKMEEEHTSNTR